MEGVKSAIKWAAEAFLSSSLEPKSKLFNTCRYVLKIFSSIQSYSRTVVEALKLYYAAEAEDEVIMAIKQWIRLGIDSGSDANWEQLNQLVGMP